MATLDGEELPPPAPSQPARRPSRGSRSPKRFLETAASGTASKRAKPALLVCKLLKPSSWVSCDICGKWRRVAQEPKADKWCCSDNQDAKHSACSVPQEMSNAAIDGALELAQDAAEVEGTSKLASGRQRAHCQHGRRRSQCKECGGGSICQHGRHRTHCKECGGASICQHGWRRSDCKGRCQNTSTAWYKSPPWHYSHTWLPPTAWISASIRELADVC